MDDRKIISNIKNLEKFYNNYNNIQIENIIYRITIGAFVLFMIYKCSKR